MAATGNEAVLLRQLKSFKDWVVGQLSGKAASSHNHAASNITSGILTVARGGTGVAANPSMLVNLASTSADTVFEAAPRPGVTGTLPIARGGTGATSAAAARTALGAAANTTATTSAAGLMSASDKAKLDSLSVPAVDIKVVTAHSTAYTKDTLEIVVDSSGIMTAMYFISV